MVYLGFLVPRLQAVTDSTGRGAAIVVFFWSTQHLVIPFIPDGTYLISRLLGAPLITAGPTLTFVLLRRRLLASTAVHWLSDTSTQSLPPSLSPVDNERARESATFLLCRLRRLSGSSAPALV